MLGFPVPSMAALRKSFRLLTSGDPLVYSEDRPGFTPYHYAEFGSYRSRSRVSQAAALAKLVSLVAAYIPDTIATELT